MNELGFYASLSKDSEFRQGFAPFRVNKAIKTMFNRKNLIEHRKKNSQEGQKVKQDKIHIENLLRGRFNAMYKKKYRQNNNLTPLLISDSLYSKKRRYTTLNNSSHKDQRHCSLLRTANQRMDEKRYSKDTKKLNLIKEKITSLDKPRVEDISLNDKSINSKQPKDYYNTPNTTHKEEMVKRIELELDKKVNEVSNYEEQEKEEEVMEAHKEALVNLSLVIPCAEDLIKKIQSAIIHYNQYNLKKLKEQINTLEAKIQQEENNNSILLSQLKRKNEESMKKKSKVPRLDLSKVKNNFVEESICFIEEPKNKSNQNTLGGSGEQVSSVVSIL